MLTVNESPGDTPIGPLLFTVFTSIFEVFLICLAGYLLARRGILDKPTQKKLNVVNVSLFTPCLLFSKVAFFLSPAKLRELWIIPLFFVAVTTVSMIVAFLLGWIFRLKKSQRSFAMAAAMFMNSNSLPIALMQSLVVTVHGLKWGEEDNNNAMLGRALTYLVLYSTLGMILRWSYGVRLLAQADDEAPTTMEEPNENTPLLNGQPQETSSPHIKVHKPDNTLRTGYARHRSTFYRSFPNSPNVSRGNFSPIESEPPSSVSTFVSPSPSISDSDSDFEDEAGPLPGVQEPSRSRTCVFRSKRVLHKGWILINDFMTVPLWAALASLVVACIRPLQFALEEHLQPITGAVSSTGNCSIPVTLIVLGAYFHNPTEEIRAKRRRRRRLTTVNSTSSLFKSVKAMFNKPKQPEQATQGETKTVVIAVVSRMIITPMLLLPFMALSAKFDLQDVFADPVFVVSNVLLISSPPALTLAQITQAASGDAFERLISRTIFWAYCIVTPPATIIYVVIGMLFSNL